MVILFKLIKPMFSKRIIKENYLWLDRLAESKGWQFDWIGLEQILTKPNPRFAHSIIKDRTSKELFFKSSLIGRLELNHRIKKEYSVQKWISKNGGPAREPKEFGVAGQTSWYTCPAFSLSLGFICQEEEISRLKSGDFKAVVEGVNWLHQVKKKELPAELLKQLLPRRTNGSLYQSLLKRINKYLQILKGAYRVEKLDWNKQDEKRVRIFFDCLKKEIDNNDTGLEKGGVLVHGDLAPNNTYFNSTKALFLDWENTWWCNNFLIGLGIDAANFYTRCFIRPRLAEDFLSRLRENRTEKKTNFDLALRIGLVVSCLQKIAPMFKEGIYRTKYDHNHFKFLVKTLRKNLDN